MNNYDKIKSLSMNDMAELLKKIGENPCMMCNAISCQEGYNCKDGWLLWLQEESK